MSAPEILLFDAATLREFAARVLAGAGATPAAAELCAEVLVASDLGGVDTHGVARLIQYAEAVLSGRVAGDAWPEVVAHFGAVTTVDANNCLGPVALTFATDLAIGEATDSGVSAVAVRGSNHAGALAWYADRASVAGMFAIVVTGSTKPMVAPIHAATPFLGTNAIAYAAPAGEEALSFDAATSVATRSMLEAYEREGRTLPEGWAVGPDGRPARDAHAVIEGLDRQTGYSLLPLGGVEHGGHKGFGVGLLVELLSGPLAGARWGRTPVGVGPADVGHFVLCLSLGAFGDPVDAVEKRIAALCTELRSLPTVAEGIEIRAPGYRRRDTAVARERDGVPLPPTVLASLDRAADLTRVPPLDRRSARPSGTSERVPSAPIRETS